MRIVLIWIHTAYRLEQAIIHKLTQNKLSTNMKNEIFISIHRPIHTYVHTYIYIHPLICKYIWYKRIFIDKHKKTHTYIHWRADCSRRFCEKGYSKFLRRGWSSVCVYIYIYTDICMSLSNKLYLYTDMTWLIVTAYQHTWIHMHIQYICKPPDENLRIRDIHAPLSYVVNLWMNACMHEENENIFIA